MSNRGLLQHTTKYVYDSSVFLSPQLVRLKPAVHCRTPIEAYSLLITPANHHIHWQQDAFGNFLARVDFTGAVQELVIDVTLIATITAINPFDFLVDEYAQFFPFSYEERLEKDLCTYLETADKGPMMLQLLEKTDTSKREII